MSDLAREKLPLRTKLLYGAPSIAGAAMAIPVAVHLNRFYSDFVLVPLALVAQAQPLARIIDAILEPFVAWLSDHSLAGAGAGPGSRSPRRSPRWSSSRCSRRRRA